MCSGVHLQHSHLLTSETFDVNHTKHYSLDNTSRLVSRWAFNKIAAMRNVDWRPAQFDVLGIIYWPKNLSPMYMKQPEVS